MCRGGAIQGVGQLAVERLLNAVVVIATHRIVGDCEEYGGSRVGYLDDVN